MIVEEFDYRQRTIAGGDVRLHRSTSRRSMVPPPTARSSGVRRLESHAGPSTGAEGVLYRHPRPTRSTSAWTAFVETAPTCSTAKRLRPSRTRPAVALLYHFNSDVSAMQFTRGWKGAQFNVSNGTRATHTLAKPERIDSVEFGFNGSWVEGRLRMNAAMFLYRYTNYQVFLFTNDFSAPPQRIVKNANVRDLART